MGKIEDKRYLEGFDRIGKNDTQNVFTPPRLIRRMLSRIAFDKNSKIFVWYNIEFLIYLVKEIGLSPNNIYIYSNTKDKLILKQQGYNVVYQEKINFDKLYHQLKKMKFDAVLGNPPYHELDKNGRPKGGGKGGANNLWSKFFIKSKEISDNVFLIHPPSFLSPNHIVLNKMYEDGGLKSLKIFDESPFEGVGTQACYYNWVRGYDGLCEIGGQLIELKEGILPNSTNLLDFSIFNKFFSGDKEKFLFLRNCKIHSQSKKNYISDNINETNRNKLYVGSKLKYTSLTIEEKLSTKVIVSRSGYLNPFFDNDSCVSESNYFCLVENEIKGQNLIKVLKSNLYDYCLKKSKFSGFFHGEVLKNIPKVDLNKEWTDEELYEYFNLTQEEIEHIGKNVK